MRNTGLAAVAASQRPQLGGLAMLFGANAALIAGFGSSAPLTLGGPLADTLGGSLPAQRVNGAGPLAEMLPAQPGNAAGGPATFTEAMNGLPHALLGGGAFGVRLLVLLAFVLVVAFLLAAVPPGDGAAVPRGDGAAVPRGDGAAVPPDGRAAVPPGDGGRWRRAGVRALLAGATLAVVCLVLSFAAGGELNLGVAVLMFQTDLLTVHVAPAVGWAALAGFAGGAMAGLLGSLLADIRWASGRG